MSDGSDQKPATGKIVSRKEVFEEAQRKAGIDPKTGKAFAQVPEEDQADSETGLTFEELQMKFDRLPLSEIKKTFLRMAEKDGAAEAPRQVAVIEEEAKRMEADLRGLFVILDTRELAPVIENMLLRFLLNFGRRGHEWREQQAKMEHATFNGQPGCPSCGSTTSEHDPRCMFYGENTPFDMTPEEQEEYSKTMAPLGGGLMSPDTPLKREDPKVVAKRAGVRLPDGARGRAKRVKHVPSAGRCDECGVAGGHRTDCSKSVV